MQRATVSAKKMVVIRPLSYVPKSGMFCILDIAGGYNHEQDSSPELNEEDTFRPLACFHYLDDAKSAPEDQIPLHQGFNAKGTRRNVLCQANYRKNTPSTVDHPSPRFEIREAGYCANYTFKGGKGPWYYGPDAWDRHQNGQRSIIDDEREDL